MKKYYIYHIKGVKIGVSTEPKKRVQRQGYSKYEIIEEHTDIDLVGIREKELQKEYGYKVDTAVYKQSREWACKGSVNGGIIAGNKNKEQFKKIASKFGKENSLKSRWKLQKKVYQYDLEYNLINTFIGAREAKRQLGYCMGANLRKKKKTCHGFIFSYEDLSSATESCSIICPSI